MSSVLFEMQPIFANGAFYRLAMRTFGRLSCRNQYGHSPRKSRFRPRGVSRNLCVALRRRRLCPHCRRTLRGVDSKQATGRSCRDFGGFARGFGDRVRNKTASPAFFGRVRPLAFVRIHRALFGEVFRHLGRISFARRVFGGGRGVRVGVFRQAQICLRGVEKKMLEIGLRGGLARKYAARGRNAFAAAERKTTQSVSPQKNHSLREIPHTPNSAIAKKK